MDRAMPPPPDLDRLCRLLVEQIQRIPDDALAPALLRKLVEVKREQLRRAAV